MVFGCFETSNRVEDEELKKCLKYINKKNVGYRSFGLEFFLAMRFNVCDISIINQTLSASFNYLKKLLNVFHETTSNETKTNILQFRKKRFIELSNHQIPNFPTKTLSQLYLLLTGINPGM
jgi:hypothetical protein